MRILVIHGPNLNMLGKRDKSIYGDKTLKEIDALLKKEASRLPVIEVHLSNIYRREEWRAESIIAPIAEGQISGLGWRGYVAALQILVGKLKAKPSR